MKRLLFIALLGTIGLISCDNRKDVIADLKKDANKAPTMTLRKAGSITSFSTDFSDTSLAATSGYRIQYSIVDNNIDLNTLKLTCLTNCSKVTYTIKQDSSIIVIYAQSGYTFNFELTVSDVYGLSATSRIELVTQNKKPVITIKSNVLGGVFTTNISDSLKTLISPLYSLSYNINDDNSDYTGIGIIKKTSGDNSQVTVTSSGIDFNYTTAATNKTYKYGIYLIDKLGKVSDTVLFNLYVFKNLTPVITGFSSPYFDNQPVPRSDAYLAKYFTSVAPWFVYPTSFNITASDKDLNFNGFINKIKIKVEYNYYTTYPTQANFVEYFTFNFLNTDGPLYPVKYYTHTYKNGTLYAGYPGKHNITATVYDNDGDSATYNNQITY